MLTYTERGKSAYGSVHGEIKNRREKYSYIIDLVNTKGTIIKGPCTSSPFAFEKVSPNKYFIRVTEDENKDGYWNPGNIFLKGKAEKLYFSKEFIVKENWTIKDISVSLSSGE